MTWTPAGKPISVDEDAPDPDVELERQDEAHIQAAWQAFAAWVANSSPESN